MLPMTLLGQTMTTLLEVYWYNLPGRRPQSEPVAP